MYKIVSKEQFSDKVFRLRVEAPLIAKANWLVNKWFGKIWVCSL